MKLRAVCLTLCLLSIVAVGAAQAVPLNVTLAPAPDVFSSFIGDNYHHLTGAFTATGYAMTLDDDGVGPLHNISGGTFSLNATINSSGVATGGTLSIGGSVPDLSIGGPLLTGTLSAFGFAGVANSPLEFVFLVSGGSLASLYGGNGASAGVILTGTGFNGTFGADFSTAFGAISDTAPVAAAPEPATLLLVLGGGAVYAVRKRCRNRRRASTERDC